MRPFRAAILSVGSELTHGRVADSNASWLAVRIRSLGGRVSEIRVLPDDLAPLSAAVRELAKANDLLVITGGLGPTEDDRTREALGGRLRLHAPSLKAIEKRFQGRTMPENNRKQAMIQAGGEAIPNPNGTAPGIRLKVGKCRILALPGVPREMMPMWERLESHLRALPSVTRLLRCYGLPESEVDRRIAHLMKPGRPAEVGVTVSSGILTVSITAWGKGSRKAVVEDEKAVRKALGLYVFGAGDETMGTVVVGMLKKKRQTLALAESVTGGLIGHLVTEVPGASKVLLEGRAVYTEAAKRRLGVPAALLNRYGPVSAEVTTALAQAARKTAGSTWGLAVTGVAGPSGGTRETPVGTVFAALVGPSGMELRHWRFASDRRQVKRRTALSALDLLRRTKTN